MIMGNITILGFAAAVLTTIAFLPQVIKICKTKSTKDISLEMFLIFCIGIFLWFIYGFLRKDYPVIVANLLVFIQALIILIFKIKYK